MPHGKDYIPTREAELVSWAENFALKVEQYAATPDSGVKYKAR